MGYGEGGQLTEAVRRKPYCLLLLDEIEKAHPDIFNILLQILEDGTITDSQGRKVNFKNTLIIMTSNLGARYLTEGKQLGFLTPESTDRAVRQQVMRELKDAFRPEFLNRIDETILFQRLTQEDVRCIAQQFLRQLKGRLDDLHISITFSDEAVSRLAVMGYDPSYGARPLRKVIRSQVEDPLAEQILQHTLVPGDRVLCKYAEEGFRFQKVVS